MSEFEKKEEIFESEVNHHITVAMCGIGTENEKTYYKKSITGLKKAKMKYWNEVEDNLSKIRLLRNLASILERCDRMEESKLYVKELYTLVKDNKDVKQNYVLEYCRAMNCYADTFKDDLSKEDVIGIEKENMEIYRELGKEFLPDFLTAKVNINFLMKDYKKIISLLLEIHTEEKRMVDLKRQIETELAEASPVDYNKYLKITKMANPLVS